MDFRYTHISIKPLGSRLHVSGLLHVVVSLCQVCSRTEIEELHGSRRARNQAGEADTPTMFIVFHGILTWCSCLSLVFIDFYPCSSLSALVSEAFGCFRGSIRSSRGLRRGLDMKTQALFRLKVTRFILDRLIIHRLTTCRSTERDLEAHGR